MVSVPRWLSLSEIVESGFVRVRSGGMIAREQTIHSTLKLEACTRHCGHNAHSPASKNTWFPSCLVLYACYWA